MGQLDILRRTFPAALALCIAAGACSGKKDDAECVQPTEPQAATKKIVQRTGLRVDHGDADWCRACVMSDKGFASCQRVYAENKAEPRDAIRKRAREKACADAGYQAGKCSDAVVIGILCKDEKEPPGSPTAGEALQRFHAGLPIQSPSAPKADAEPAKPPQSSGATKPPAPL